MSKWIRFAVMLLMLASASNSWAASSEVFKSDRLTARIITAEDGIAPDAKIISAALEIDLSEDWKTYWKAPGEVGYPPSIDWSKSDNIADVDFMWPAPKRFLAFGIENYGYKDHVSFPLKITLDQPGVPTNITASVSILACAAICVPENFELSLHLNPGSTIDRDSAAAIASAVTHVPALNDNAGLSLGDVYIDEKRTFLTLAFASNAPLIAPEIFPDFGLDAAFGAPDIRIDPTGRKAWAQLPILNASAELPDLELTITDGQRAAVFKPEFSLTKPAKPMGPSTTTGTSLLWIIGIALLGGVILNVMPCVLPVLSIKLTSALKAHDQSPARIRAGFVMSALGVVSFMWALAAILIAIRLSGGQIGWGIQFQNPVFLGLMTGVIAIFAANMAGLFDITLPQSWNTKLAHADGQPGLVGDFLTGTMAAMLATPCSAPFLGTAVTFALAGSAIETLVIFSALGAGLALPYILIALRPGLIKALPKPGRWMLLVKWVMGAFLALTALWLLSVLWRVSGLGAAIVVLTISLIAIGILSSQRVRPALRMATAPIALILVMVAPLAFQSPQQSAPMFSSQDIWQNFERSEIARHVAQNKVVFVDVTADWCLSCKANKAIVLESGPVMAELANENVIAMQADWTRPDDTILRYLQANGRYGIPFNIIYGPGAPNGIALPEILTQDTVLTALRKAKG